MIPILKLKQITALMLHCHRISLIIAIILLIAWILQLVILIKRVLQLKNQKQTKNKHHLIFKTISVIILTMSLMFTMVNTNEAKMYYNADEINIENEQAGHKPPYQIRKARWFLYL